MLCPIILIQLARYDLWDPSCNLSLRCETKKRIQISHARRNLMINNTLARYA